MKIVRCDMSHKSGIIATLLSLRCLREVASNVNGNRSDLEGVWAGRIAFVWKVVERKRTRNAGSLPASHLTHRHNMDM